MFGDVGDVFLRIFGVPSWLPVVVHVGAGDQVAVAIGELVAGQVASHAHADLVALQQQGGQLFLWRAGDGGLAVVVAAIGKALLLEQSLSRIEGPNPTDSVA